MYSLSVLLRAMRACFFEDHKDLLSNRGALKASKLVILLHECGF